MLHERRLVPQAVLGAVCAVIVRAPVDGLHGHTDAVNGDVGHGLAEHADGQASPDEAATAHVTRELHADGQRHQRHGGVRAQAHALHAGLEMRLDVSQTAAFRVAKRAERQWLDTWQHANQYELKKVCLHACVSIMHIVLFLARQHQFENSAVPLF